MNAIGTYFFFVKVGIIDGQQILDNFVGNMDVARVNRSATRR